MVIIVGVILFFTQSNQYNSAQNEDETIQKDEIPKYEYRAFKPSFKSTSDSDYEDYDFTKDMTYMDKIYYKKIITIQKQAKKIPTKQKAVSVNLIYYPFDDF